MFTDLNEAGSGYNKAMVSQQQSESTLVHYRAAVKTAQILNHHGFEAYIIGGAVRDMLLGHLPKDFDLVTNAKPDQILKLEEVERSAYKDTAQAFGVTRVRVANSEIEIATYRRDIEAHLGRRATKIAFSHLDDDIARRDLTINALALDPLDNFLVDYVGGLDDLEHRLVRFIGEPPARIAEDPLRIMRAIRLKNQLDFSYEPQSEAALAAAIKGGQLALIAPDRLRQELTRMLVHHSRRQALTDLDLLGALDKLLPELVSAKGVSQPRQYHREGDVFEHTLLALENLPATTSAELAWATLLHDIGKPPTHVSAVDRIRFNQHYKVGAQIAQTILKRFKFSNKAIGHISWMVHNHLSIDQLPTMRPGRQRAMMAHPAFAELLQLHKADAQAALATLPDGTIDNSQPQFPEIEQLWEQYQLQAHTEPLTLKSQLKIDGHWLKKHFDLDGAQLGQVLQQLEEAYQDGLVKTRADATKYVKQLIH